jgi:hypothetical protein
MHSKSEPELRLRAKQFEIHSRAIGLETDRARAAHLGVSHTTVARIVAGDIRPGERFIARVLAAFPDSKFEDLFEVVRIRPNRRAA